MRTNDQWKMVKLRNFVSFQTGKLNSNAAKPDGEYPFFTCAQETFSINTYSFDTECVLLAGNNANGVYPIKYFSGKFDAYQRTYIIRPLDDTKLNTRFLYFVLQPQLELMRSISTGAATKFLTLTILKDIEIGIPPLPIQRKIAAVLSTYDDLIEANTRRIRILEQMAQTIYHEWFGKVDAQFLPEGWEMKTLDYVLSEIESGSRPKGGIDPNQRGVPSVGAENIIGLGKYNYASEKYVSSDFYNAMTRGHIKNKDVLIYKDGASIGRKSMFRDGFPHDECCINEHVFILRTNEKCTQNFLYFWLDLPDMTQNIKNLNANAAQPGINQAGVKGLPILLPDEIMLKKLDDVINPMMGLLFNLAKKNANLQRTRDLLLPRLVSGEVGLEGIEVEMGEYQ